MPIFVDESEEKGSKRRIDVKLVNKGQNYDPFYPIFQQLSSTIFARFKFLERFFSCTNSLVPTSKHRKRYNKCIGSTLLSRPVGGKVTIVSSPRKF